MKPATITLGAALFLVVGTSSALILRQHAQIEELRARLDAAATVRAPAPAPEMFEPAELPAEATTPESPAASPGVTILRAGGAEEEVAQQRPNPRRRGANRFAELLADPEVVELMMVQRKGELDGRYAALFKKLNLSAEETDALKTLLAEKRLARMETNAVARAEGIGGNDREMMQELVRESDEEVEARMRELLGNDRYGKLQEYESTTQERARVQQPDLRLSYSQAPLLPYQSEALVAIYAAAPPEPRLTGRNVTAEETTAYFNQLQAYDAQIYTRAQTILNATQLESFRQIQNERMDRARLNALMRSRSESGG
jgi:hypothetical protein